MYFGALVGEYYFPNVYMIRIKLFLIYTYVTVCNILIKLFKEMLHNCHKRPVTVK
jgi:hypothetical protein